MKGSGEEGKGDAGENRFSFRVIDRPFHQESPGVLNFIEQMHGLPLQQLVRADLASRRFSPGKQDARSAEPTVPRKMPVGKNLEFREPLWSECPLGELV